MVLRNNGFLSVPWDSQEEGDEGSNEDASIRIGICR